MGKAVFCVKYPKRGIQTSVALEEREISVVNEARRSPGRLPWCAVRPVTDDCFEKEGTTKEAGMTKGMLAMIQAGWVSVNLKCSSAANWFEHENPCGGLEREDRSQGRLVRCISERGLGD